MVCAIDYKVLEGHVRICGSAVLNTEFVKCVDGL